MKLGLTCKIERQCFYKTLVLGDSDVLLTSPLHKPTKRYPKLANVTLAQDALRLRENAYRLQSLNPGLKYGAYI